MKTKWYKLSNRQPDDKTVCIVVDNEGTHELAKFCDEGTETYWMMGGSSYKTNSTDLWMPIPDHSKEKYSMKQTKKFTITRALFAKHPSMLTYVREEFKDLVKAHFVNEQDYDAIDRANGWEEGKAKKDIGAFQRKFYTPLLEILLNMDHIPEAGKKVEEDV